MFKNIITTPHKASFEKSTQITLDKPRQNGNRKNQFY
jgi:hypothetical protein